MFHDRVVRERIAAGEAGSDSKSPFSISRLFLPFLCSLRTASGICRWHQLRCSTPCPFCLPRLRKRFRLFPSSSRFSRSRWRQLYPYLSSAPPRAGWPSERFLLFLPVQNAASKRQGCDLWLLIFRER